ncbi:hypothetical protein ACHAWC_003730 [Mediolabrus comicus]
MYTSADITETMRIESVTEMKNVNSVLNSVSPLESNIPLLLQSNNEVLDYLDDNAIQNYLFDCDGVLYRGTDPMPSASQAIQQLIKKDKQVFFVTNNAASTRAELKSKLEKVLRCEGVLKEEMMIGSAFVAGQYLKPRLLKQNGEKARVHVIGTSGLCSELKNAGFDISGGQDPIDTPSGMSRDELAAYTFPEGKIDALVIGLDNDFNYRKLCIATVLLQRNPDALLVATNMDAFDLVGYDSRHLPGNGALVSAVEMASGRRSINVGKPSSTLSELIMDVYGLKPEETMMIGDRLDTDIKFGNENKMHSALVLTGCTTSSDIQSLLNDDTTSQTMIPSVIFPHVGLMCDAEDVDD